MFTGIIEKSVRVLGVADGPMFRRLTLACHWPDLKNGESIAINGVCLTVAQLAKGEVGFDVITETLSKTNLGLLKPGDAVHVERAMAVGDRIDGHFVQGHVDGTASQLRRTETEHEVRVALEVPAHLAKYMVPKGSVAVDGVSMTIASVHGRVVEIALIPTTLQITLLGRRPDAWPFNIEADVLSKTIVNWLELRESAQDDPMTTNH